MGAQTVATLKLPPHNNFGRDGGFFHTAGYESGLEPHPMSTSGLEDLSYPRPRDGLPTV